MVPQSSISDAIATVRSDKEGKSIAIKVSESENPALGRVF